MHALPARLGGLGIANPVEDAEFEYKNLKFMTEQLTDAIFQQHDRFFIEEDRQEQGSKVMKEELKVLLSDQILKVIDLSAEKGAYLWLTSGCVSTSSSSINILNRLPQPTLVDEDIEHRAMC